MKSGTTERPMADSVASQADCTDRKKRQHPKGVQGSPRDAVQRNGKRLSPLVVLVCQQTPRRLLLVRERLLRRILCRSPNLRPPCRANRRPPKKSRRSCGQWGLQMYLSHATTTATGKGSASLRSVVGWVRKALMRPACMRGWRAGTSACRPSHERALRIGLGPILQTSRSSSRLFSQPCRKSAGKGNIY